MFYWKYAAFLEHLETLCVVRPSRLQHAPEESNLALETNEVVVATHAVEDKRSLKKDLLSTKTDLRVCQVILCSAVQPEAGYTKN